MGKQITFPTKNSMWYVYCSAYLVSLIFYFVYQPFTHRFPRADIHELLVPDLLHQLIKGTFKDHLVTWVGDYLYQTHGEVAVLDIIEDIDHW